MAIHAAEVLADWLDHECAWDWPDGAEHVPSDRMAVCTVRRFGGVRLAAVVYRGTEPDAIELFANLALARSAMRAHVESMTTPTIRPSTLN